MGRAIFAVENVKVIIEGGRVKPLKLLLPERFYSFTHANQLARVVKAAECYGSMLIRNKVTGLK